jgi:uncharacterized DUF497 family protein
MTNVITIAMSWVVTGFQWDDGNWPKCAKHGVSKAEIEEVPRSKRFSAESLQF